MPILHMREVSNGGRINGVGQSADKRCATILPSEGPPRMLPSDRSSTKLLQAIYQTLSRFLSRTSQGHAGRTSSRLIGHPLFLNPHAKLRRTHPYQPYPRRRSWRLIETGACTLYTYAKVLGLDRSLELDLLPIIRARGDHSWSVYSSSVRDSLRMLGMSRWHMRDILSP